MYACPCVQVYISPLCNLTSCQFCAVLLAGMASEQILCARRRTGRSHRCMADLRKRLSAGKIKKTSAFGASLQELSSGSCVRKRHGGLEISSFSFLSWYRLCTLCNHAFPVRKLFFFVVVVFEIELLVFTAKQLPGKVCSPIFNLFYFILLLF